MTASDDDAINQRLLESNASIPLEPLGEHSFDPEPTPAEHRSPQIDNKPNEQSRLLASIGLAFAMTVGLSCVVAGVIIATLRTDVYRVVLPPEWPGGPPTYSIISGSVAILPNAGHRLFIPELVRFAFTNLNTIATEAIGFVHSVTQRSVLATATVARNPLRPPKGPIERSALKFNSNLRLFTVPHGPGIGSFHPNGTFFNLVMALLLILSYAAISLSLLDFSATQCPHGAPGSDCADQEEWDSICVFAIPIIVLGVSIVLKTAIAIAGIRCTRVLTWSSSPLNNTAAVLIDGQVVRIPGRCMYNVLDTTSPGSRALSQTEETLPKRPSSIQPSAWQAHRSIRRIVVSLWVLVVICGVWGGVVVAAWHSDTQSTSNFNTPGLESWSLIPGNRSNAVTFGPSFQGPGNIPATSWIICFLVLIVVQGALTIALHCCELIVNVLRDEDTWRKSITKEGTKPVSFLKSLVAFWPNVALQLAKPFLRERPFAKFISGAPLICIHMSDWMFGFCLSLKGTIAYFGDNASSGGTQSSLQVIMRSVQAWYLMIAFALFSAGITLLATRQPRGPLPAAYGHIQTLANLIDAWAPDMTMWWGDKHAGRYEKDRQVIRHAGTGQTSLPPVDLSSLYA
ncbi:hypothetical protein BDW22DRAFT_1356794 [Trametopsis cervina]|nr:hypothetical protein BDW22DRAFT_1356794 [Trametopsis cervina]